MASLNSIKNIVILDSEGNRVLSKYYGDQRTKEQRVSYEKKLFEKTQKTAAKDEAEILLFDSLITVFRQSNNVWVYISGASDENELFLYFALTAVLDALNELGKGAFDKDTLMDNLDLVFLALDEIVDSGIFLESDGVSVAGRVMIRGEDFGEQSLQQVFNSARDTVVNVLQKL